MELGSTLWYGTVQGWYFTKDWVTSWFDTPPTMEETIRRLESVREQVFQRESTLRETMEKHRRLASDYARQKQVREAKMQIRLRLLYDNQVMAVQKTLTAIESHLVAIQSANLNREVFLALHDSSRALGKGSLQDEDAVDDVLERLDEQHLQSQNIMDIINTSPMDANTLTDDDVEKELQALMQDDTENPLTTILPSVPQTVVMPSGKNTQPVALEEGDSV